MLLTFSNKHNETKRVLLKSRNLWKHIYIYIYTYFDKSTTWWTKSDILSIYPKWGGCIKKCIPEVKSLNEIVTLLQLHFYINKKYIRYGEFRSFLKPKSIQSLKKLFSLILISILPFLEAYYFTKKFLNHRLDLRWFQGCRTFTFLSRMYLKG